MEASNKSYPDYLTPEHHHNTGHHYSAQEMDIIRKKYNHLDFKVTYYPPSSRSLLLRPPISLLPLSPFCVLPFPFSPIFHMNKRAQPLVLCLISPSYSPGRSHAPFS